MTYGFFQFSGVMLVVLFVFVVLAAGCGESKPSNAPPLREVVVYTALDRVHSEPILKAFEKKTGIHVLPKYDAEAAKTTGLVNALIARRDDPECDVLWNNEMVQTEALAGMGLFQPYISPNAHRIPARYRDPGNRWTGFAARLRVIIYNTDLVEPDHAPHLLSDFADPRWRNMAAIAEPYFGTTFTHMTVLYKRWGNERLQDWWRDILDNGAAVTPGNGPVRDMVASGERVFGLTDTDDAYAALQSGKPVAVVLPDANDGALVIPNTVSLIANCPHEEAGRALIDYLLSTEVERALAVGASAQIPLGRDLSTLETPWKTMLEQTMPADIDVAQIARSRPATIELLQRALGDR